MAMTLNIGATILQYVKYLQFILVIRSSSIFSFTPHHSLVRQVFSPNTQMVHSSGLPKVKILLSGLDGEDKYLSTFTSGEVYIQLPLYFEVFWKLWDAG